MRNLFKIICFISTLSIITSCSKEYEVPQNLIVHDFVWKGLNAYYLHQDQIADLSDRRFNSDEQLSAYLNSFPDYNTLFSNLLLESDEKSMLIEDYNTITKPTIRTGFTNGLEFGIIADPSSSENVLGFVTHILPNSNAANKAIDRGEYFYAVDGVQLTRTNYEDLLLNGNNDFTLFMANFDGVNITPNAKTVNLEKEEYIYPATFLSKVIPVNSNNIGYLMYNNDFSTNYLNDIKNIGVDFTNQNVSQLILDLRYNIGGGSFAKNIEKLASIITGQFQNEVFIKEQWNTKAQEWFLNNQPDSLNTRFSTNINQSVSDNGMQVTDLYIILNGKNFSGSSAVELLINSLDAYINVHVIGNQTSGNNTGAITLYNSDDYDFELKETSHTVALQPIVLSFLNKNDQSYENGLTPVIDLCNTEDVLNLGVLGETSDPILNSIIQYIETGNANTVNSCNVNNYEYLFNSIDNQRVVDRGVFIEQNLPNTN